MIPAKDQEIVFAEPFLERGEARAGLAFLHLSDERGLVAAEDVDVDVVAGAAEAAGTAEGVPLSLNAESTVAIDNLALASVADAAMPGAAGGSPTATLVAVLGPPLLTTMV